MLICVFPSLFRSGRWRFDGSPPLKRVDGRSNVHPPPMGELAPEAELLDEGTVALDVLALQVVQEAAAAADELEQAPAGVVILGVRAQVLGEVVDATCQHRDLNLGRARIGCRPAVLADQLQLRFLGESHVSPSVVVSAIPARREGRTRPEPRPRSARMVAAAPR